VESNDSTFFCFVSQYCSCSMSLGCLTSALNLSIQTALIWLRFGSKSSIRNLYFLQLKRNKMIYAYFGWILTQSACKVPDNKHLWWDPWSPIPPLRPPHSLNFYLTSTRSALLSILIHFLHRLIIIAQHPKEILIGIKRCLQWKKDGNIIGPLYNFM